jgi:glycosyltransferase involved in cell wall biosynthesis
LQRERPQSLAEQSLFFDRLRRDLSAQILSADFVLCASEKQRDYYLGAMSALGRVNPYSHGDDPSLRRLIAVVPFGLPSEPPRHTYQVLKGVHPGIGPNDKVLFWGGGIWDWLDAPTLIYAMDRLGGQRPDIKLFFATVKHPNPQEAERKAVTETIALSKELSLCDRTVFFNEWIPYAERGNYLLEADLGVSLHQEHLETQFSFRNRFLDYLWAGLPVVATRGDVISDQVKAHNLGRVVEPGDVDGVAEAILSLLDTPNLRAAYRLRFEQVAATYCWDAVVRPLVEFCLSPHIASDKAYVQETVAFEAGPTPWWKLPGKAWHALRLGGVRGLARQVSNYRRWLAVRRGQA